MFIYCMMSHRQETLLACGLQVFMTRLLLSLDQ